MFHSTTRRNLPSFAVLGNSGLTPFQLTFDLVVADKGNEFYAIATTPSVVTFGGKRVH